MSIGQPAAPCPQCGAPRGDGRFCATCGVLNQFPDSGAHVTSLARRLALYVGDLILIAALFGVGWLLWLALAARRSQTPACQLLGLYILKGDGTPASAPRIWLREAVRIAFFFVSFVWVVDAVWALWDKDRKMLHDKLADTVVVRAPKAAGAGPAPPPQAQAPGGTAPYAPDARVEQRLQELESLRRKGLITEREYEERRRRIIDER